MRRRPRILIAAAVLLAVAVAAYVALHDGSGFREPRGVGDVTDRLDDAVPAALRGARVPGASVAVVRDGRVVWTGGYGEARDGVRMTADTQLQVGSLSKAVTAWGVVASGEPPLDERVPEWDVTPRQLLSHTAGLSVGGYQGVPPGRPVGTTQQSLAGTGGEGPSSRVERVGEAGKDVRYSGGGYTVLQDVIERRTGFSFADWADPAVLRPLGMRSSTFDAAADGARPAPGRRSRAAGHDARGRRVPSYRYAELAAAGLWSTAADMGRFAAAIERDPGELGTAQPGTGGHYGLGLDVGKLGDGTRKLWHEGVNRGWHARLLVYPGRGWGAVVLTNGDGGGAVADAVQDVFER